MLRDSSLLKVEKDDDLGGGCLYGHELPGPSLTIQVQSDLNVNAQMRTEIDPRSI